MSHPDLVALFTSYHHLSRKMDTPPREITLTWNYRYPLSLGGFLLYCKRSPILTFNRYQKQPPVCKPKHCPLCKMAANFCLGVAIHLKMISYTWYIFLHFYKGDNFCDPAFMHSCSQTPSEKESTLKGNNLLPR